MVKQLKSLGVRTWTDTDTNAIESIDTIPIQDNWAYLHIIIYIFCTDAGPDQHACDHLVGCELEGMQCVLKVRQYCYQHAVHLMVTRWGLKGSEFSS
eukprot:3484851-Alexandrium_andersonii.AAC.1